MSTKGQQVIEAQTLTDEEELPEGWAKTVLDVVGKWSTGGTPSRKIGSYFGGGTAWVKSGDLNDGYITETEETISRTGLQNSAAKVVPPGTVSIALYGATIGKLGILRIEAATNQACASCQVDEALTSNKFVFYYLLHQRQALIAAGQGGAQPNLTNQIVREWPVILPPLAEQERIVNRIEQLLVELDSAKTRLSKLPLFLKWFRQAVLAAACSGKLTEDWRRENPSINAAATLLAEILEKRREWFERSKDRKNSRYKQPLGLDLQESSELPPEWRSATIDQISTLITKGSSPGWQGFEYTASGVTFVRSQNVLWGTLRTDDLVYLPEQFNDTHRNSIIHEGDVLLNLVGASIGRSAIATAKIEGANSNQAVGIIRLVPNGVMNKFLLAYLLSPQAQSHIHETKVDVARANFNLDDIRPMPIPVPPPEEQLEIVRRVEALFKLADAIEKRVAATSLRAEKLAQTILAKAFRGELVPTEAELARREGRAYEPASKLLERIKAGDKGGAASKAWKRGSRFDPKRQQ
jgi:type I restriction enzyme S subunit